MNASTTVPEAVLHLIDRFQTHAESYRNGRYNETQLRREFLDPFFKALGWDVDNEQGYAEAYKDVIHEDAIDVGGATKAPDYCFRIGGTRKFFVEAKKPSVDIKGDPSPAYQLRRYAWSAKLPLSILSDFEEFAVYDCRIRPNPEDKPSTARVLYLKSAEYAEPAKWSQIASVFSREAVLKGSFDKYAESSRRKKGTAEVDEAFLREIEDWREALARNIALRNRKLSQRELNYAVGKTIDRIIFLRICEDRGVEHYGTLQGLIAGPGIYPRLFERFQRADERYNSGLFHFSKEKDRPENPDELTPGLEIDDKVFRAIIGRLYYPDSPYEFSVLSADILGQVYEQFLGKVIRLTSGHRAVVEAKPEVRKAGGVYYTPTYIVEYIVQNTVGNLVKGKTPQEIGGLTDTWKPSKSRRPLTILDPACGSGSFLLGAYQFLLDWYRDAYVIDGPEKHKLGNAPRLYQHASGQWRLTTPERKRILLSHIYGVDIDTQAVEVTKLSLLLKVLEGETQQSLDNQLRLFHERALPDLGSNIKCGNSLIGPDFYEGKQMDLFGDEEALRINAFDWNTEFKNIMNAGGFDAVIGNPPYVLLQNEFRDNSQLAYFRSHYAAASYKLDTYHLFMERSVRLTAKGGHCSMITPANFLTNNYLSELRRLLIQRSFIDHIIVIDGGVFHGVSIDNAIFVVRSGEETRDSFSIRHARIEAGNLHCGSETTVSVAGAMNSSHALFTGASTSQLGQLVDRLLGRCMRLGDIADINFGKQLRNRKQFVKDVIEVAASQDVPPRYRPCYTGRDVKRYHLIWGHLACLDDEIARSGGCWDPTKQNTKHKLITPQIGRHPVFAIDTMGYQCLNTMFMVNVHGDTEDPRYLLGLLNSRLVMAVWLDKFYDQRRTFPKIKGTYLEQIPIPQAGRSDKHGNDRPRLLILVQTMLDLHNQLLKVKTDHEKTALHRRIATTDAQIDRLVYELYGLTEDEIEIVEEATR